ncbi:hypothetical protein EYF80_030308 [Liparis tanakae]|uniref:Uncharacterized protein n=1 Tax=Liparis tanakae TaxID=230148 RepID=A0A4Z2H328_9TELE|nr:hypothetical protein EYF80_030308 [Liparis tanakae]
MKRRDDTGEKESEKGAIMWHRLEYYGLHRRDIGEFHFRSVVVCSHTPSSAGGLEVPGALESVHAFVR